MSSEEDTKPERKRIYATGEGNRDMKELLGGKGANLQELHNLGINVPAFYTITTEACTEYFSAGDKPEFIEDLIAEARPHIAGIEDAMGRSFGAAENPLLVSVRSGAKVSMPGMMDTILNVGLSDASLEGLAQSFYADNLPDTDAKYSEQKEIADRFAVDSYRRLLEMFAPTVFEDKKDALEDAFENALNKVKAKVLGRARSSKTSLTMDDIKDTDLTKDDLKLVIKGYKDIYKAHGLGDVLEECFENPDAQDAAYAQLKYAKGAVFESANSPRARIYKESIDQPANLGTAVNVQAMVYGNFGDDCATGVLITRNNATGENVIHGDWLQNAQGEDVVAGKRRSNPIKELEDIMPEQYKRLVSDAKRVEDHYKDVQDMEFTIERGKLWLLQTRSAKRTAQASLVFGVDMYEEGLISQEEAVSRFSPDEMQVLMHSVFDPTAELIPISQATPAGPGDVSGVVALTPDYAHELAGKEYKVALLRPTTTPDDIKGMLASTGIITKTGGTSSHAALVGKQYNKAVIVGEKTLEIYEGETPGTGKAIIAGETFIEGEDIISFSGSTGEMYKGEVPTIDSEIARVAEGKLNKADSRIYGYYERMRSYANTIRKLGVRANSDTSIDARVAKLFGAEGIGLLRTEHTMFKEASQIYAMREMILASDADSRKKALEVIEKLQTENCYEVFEAMDGLPVTVRLLDPPLDEFLPGPEQLQGFVEQYCDRHGGEPEQVKATLEKRLDDLKEANPMMGFRGNRLAVVYPEIAEMQARSIFEAMYQLKREGYNPKVEIMAPVTICKGEIEYTKALIDGVRKDIDTKYASQNINIGEVPFGTMIETPRAAILGGEMAEVAEFFSFGTNDLTQLTLGIDRGSVGYLPTYTEQGWLPTAPFVSIDEAGVGKLVNDGTIAGRETNPKLKVGVCGDHGGDPPSIDFFHQTGLDYISCPAPAVPVAIIAAAHAQLKNPR